MHSKLIRPSLLHRLVTIFIVAAVLNYVWEIGQGFLYSGMDYKKAVWWHCFVASLGDGILILLIYFTGLIVLRRTDWFAVQIRGRYPVMLVAGLAFGLGTEWIGIKLLHRWTYTEQMPLLPGLRIGLVPVLQMLLLPPAIFAIVAKWDARSN